MAITPGKPLLPADLYRPMCCVVQQAAQTGWTTGAATAVTFGVGSEVVDTDSLHNESSNTSRIVIGGKLGWWQISGNFCPATNAAATSLRSILYLNGVAINGSFGGATGASSFLGVPTPAITVRATSATDYVELYGLVVAASGTLGTSISAPYVASSLTAIYLRDA